MGAADAVPADSQTQTSTTVIFIFVFWIAKIKWRLWWDPILHRMAPLVSPLPPPVDGKRLESVGTPGVLSSRRFGLDRPSRRTDMTVDGCFYFCDSLRCLRPRPPSFVALRYTMIYLPLHMFAVTRSVVPVLVTACVYRGSSTIIMTSKQLTPWVHKYMKGTHQIIVSAGLGGAKDNWQGHITRVYWSCVATGDDNVVRKVGISFAFMRTRNWEIISSLLRCPTLYYHILNSKMVQQYTHAAFIVSERNDNLPLRGQALLCMWEGWIWWRWVAVLPSLTKDKEWSERTRQTRA